MQRRSNAAGLSPRAARPAAKKTTATMLLITLFPNQIESHRFENATSIHATKRSVRCVVGGVRAVGGNGCSGWRPVTSAWERTDSSEPNTKWLTTGLSPRQMARPDAGGATWLPFSLQPAGNTSGSAATRTRNRTASTAPIVERIRTYSKPAVRSNGPDGAFHPQVRHPVAHDRRGCPRNDDRWTAAPRRSCSTRTGSSGHGPAATPGGGCCPASAGT